MRSFDAVSGAKQIRITVKMPHSHPDGWAPQEIGLFIDHHLGGGEPLATVGEPRVEGDKVRLTCTNTLKLTQAALHLTTGEGPFNKRDWFSLPGTIDGNTISADAPPSDATAWFLTVTDKRGAVVSSRVTIREPK